MFCYIHLALIVVQNKQKKQLKKCMYDNDIQKSEFDSAIFSSDFIILGLYVCTQNI